MSIKTLRSSVRQCGASRLAAITLLSVLRPWYEYRRYLSGQTFARLCATFQVQNFCQTKNSTCVNTRYLQFLDGRFCLFRFLQEPECSPRSVVSKLFGPLFADKHWIVSYVLVLLRQDWPCACQKSKNKQNLQKMKMCPWRQDASPKLLFTESETVGEWPRCVDNCASNSRICFGTLCGTENFWQATQSRRNTVLRVFHCGFHTDPFKQRARQESNSRNTLYLHPRHTSVLHGAATGSTSWISCLLYATSDLMRIWACFSVADIPQVFSSNSNSPTCLFLSRSSSELPE